MSSLQNGFGEKRVGYGGAFAGGSRFYFLPKSPAEAFVDSVVLLFSRCIFLLLTKGSWPLYAAAVVIVVVVVFVVMTF